jgi:TatA/E family protein of Tat protein translocase
VLDLSPTKLVIIVVVAVVLLGPKRLPQLARQLGAGWRKLRTLQRRIDAELRESVPDLPTSQDIARFARSPLAALNRLAEIRDEGDDPGADADSGAARDAEPQSGAPPGLGQSLDVVAPGGLLALDDPTLN